MLEFLAEQGVSQSLVEEVRAFRRFYKVESEVADRVPVPYYRYYGKEIWEMAIAALLGGENLLLTGIKATGKNVLAENLTAVFGRPQWTTSFHINIDQSALIGTDTFTGGEVRFRPGSIYECAKYGGFGVLDEINMAKNEAMAVMYSALDYRRKIDVPGYQQIELHEATRFIGTMNYGYVGTKELNEAFASRFMVIDIPPMSEDKIMQILLGEFPNLTDESAAAFTGLFLDLQKKSLHSEISTKAIDFRGLLGAIRAVKRGLKPALAVKMGIAGKVFDEFEKELVQDVIDLRIPKNATAESIFKK
ncbi:MoxR family ATPase [Clostridiales bacterium COT073_COT-073]|nr:MoxR family ATPase [Clostridiales bacterium COT073_COT-073]